MKEINDKMNSWDILYSKREFRYEKRRARGDRHFTVLCAIINESTCPYRLRTDHEHLRHRQRARAAERLLRRYWVEGRDYRESESGLLWPISHH